MKTIIRKRISPLLFVAMSLGAFLSHASYAETLDNKMFTYFELDKLEYRLQDEGDLYVWDAQGWAGSDYNKVAFKTEGERTTDGETESAEFQILYKRLISTFFDVQAGVRYDSHPDPSRSYFVLGVQGLAPQWFEVDANAFVSDEGDVSARFEAEYDLLFTQRLKLRSEAEVNLAFSDDGALGIESGFTGIEIGFRLRYEIRREIAPYIGVNWETLLGDTADLAKQGGRSKDAFSVVVGINAFF